mmetsp:Transcript_8843/g.54406  ORF Transcript_8843/g.54406 Transcript_8843/m.54406 type:complete len:251 (+) Transcript_8843:2113-2865(+)
MNSTANRRFTICSAKGATSTGRSGAFFFEFKPEYRTGIKDRENASHFMRKQVQREGTKGVVTLRRVGPVEVFGNGTECGLACMQESTGLCPEATMELHAILQWITMCYCYRHATQCPISFKPNTLVIWWMCFQTFIELSKGTEFCQIAETENLYLIQPQQIHHHFGHSTQTWFQFLELPQCTNAGTSLRSQLCHCCSLEPTFSRADPGLMKKCASHLSTHSLPHTCVQQVLCTGKANRQVRFCQILCLTF